jgi:hypothetical protein
MRIAGAANPNLFNLLIIPGVIYCMSCFGTSRSLSLPSLQGSITRIGSWSFLPILNFDSAFTRSFPALPGFDPYTMATKFPFWAFSSSFF